MRYLLPLLLLSSLSWAASDIQVLNWQPTPGISEAQAVTKTQAGVVDTLAWDDDVNVCQPDVEDIRGFEYQPAKLMDGRPAFSIISYTRGPADRCQLILEYDCRTVFAQDPSGEWVEVYTECEPTYGHS